MTDHKLEPGGAVPDAGEIAPGDRVLLQAGDHDRPIVLSHLRGTRDAPIVITVADKVASKDASLTGPMDAATARSFINEEVRRREASGFYPAPGYLGDLAALTLADCQYVIVENLLFDQCWLTGIYINDCRFIAVRSCSFRGGTIAIGANGGDTRNLLIENCDWVQDVSDEHELWREISWEAVHGSSGNRKQSAVFDTDHRHFDGDFFRAWDIAGDVTLRGNTVSDAFNGIHFFNRTDRLETGNRDVGQTRRSTTNVLIEHNNFTRIRDNVFEPEDHAWNWVIRHNRLLDCYVPFSFEFERAGFFYVYGNQGVFLEPPSREIDNAPRTGFALYKTKGTQRNEGPIWFCFNSWAYGPAGGRGFRRYALGRLQHFNNLVQFLAPKEGRFFGNRGREKGPGAAQPLTATSLAGELFMERKRFTRRWAGMTDDPDAVEAVTGVTTDLGIAMDGDMINDPAFPGTFRKAGYPLGTAASGASPNFVIPADLPQTASDVLLQPQNEETRGTSLPLRLETPHGPHIKLPGGYDRGATQTDAALYEILLDPAFIFLPDHSWASGAAVT